MRPNLHAEIRPPLPTRQTLFPLLNSFYATRAILSYLTPLELQTTVAYLNKWAYSYMKLNRNPHLIYGRSDFSISTVFREGEAVFVKSVDLDNAMVTITRICEFPRELTLFKSIENYKNELYIIGGYDESLESAVAFCFRYENGELIEEKAMGTARTVFSVVVYGSSMLVVGGFNFGTLSVCEKYSFSAKQWSKEASLSIPRCSPIPVSYTHLTLPTICSV
eukprot:TRINITY_DN9856_c0_g2_i5.p1 TRINITY_DN9856_c0_g2~~TRINITY_DN9856_c0_g2_i5.p1  ORF type:complete len:221 (+),score=41.42 TRINITY_DN9856_c0_g2_i5:126-788(+)